MSHPPDLARRLWQKDPSLWPGDPEVIRNRLGWLDLPGAMPDRIAPLSRFAGELKGEGVRQVLLLGMGGSNRDIIGSYQGQFIFIDATGVKVGKSLTGGRFFFLARTGDGRLAIPGAIRRDIEGRPIAVAAPPETN